MKVVDWDEFKNIRLKAERGLGFEDVFTAINDGGLLEDIPHPNKNQYQNQRLFVVIINDYVYLVPYVEEETKMFFKTIIPSRKATKKYLRGGKS